MLSNAHFLAKFRFDTAENEPAQNLKKKSVHPNHNPKTAGEVPSKDAPRDGRRPSGDARRAAHAAGVSAAANVPAGGRVPGPPPAVPEPPDRRTVSAGRESSVKIKWKIKCSCK